MCFVSGLHSVNKCLFLSLLLSDRFLRLFDRETDRSRPWSRWIDISTNPALFCSAAQRESNAGTELKNYGGSMYNIVLVAHLRPGKGVC